MLRCQSTVVPVPISMPLDARQSCLLLNIHELVNLSSSAIEHHYHSLNILGTIKQMHVVVGFRDTGC